jgi:uncharacterized protein (DUF58 family)
MDDSTLDARVADGIVADVASLIALGDRAGRLVLNLNLGARSILAGAHLSRFRGRGMDYAESRAYHPGDDVRHIDWRVTARTGQPHTKLFIEERERPVFLLLDFSPGMFFGTRGSFKSVTAARAAAYAAWSVVAAGDRVGGVIAGDGGIRDLRPASGRRGVLRLLKVIADATEPPGKLAFTNSASRLDDALLHLCSVVHPGSLVMVFSDFQHCGERTRRHLVQLQKHSNVVACQVLDPLEIDLPDPDSYPISDGIHNARLDLKLRRGRGRYQRYLVKRRQMVRALFGGLRIPLVELVNGGDLEATLALAFGGDRGGRRA